MVAGDVTVDIIATPISASTIDTAVTTIRTAIGANGTWNIFNIDGQAIVVGIEEA